uniref:Uncharacterized protein n=1 Tax=Picea sitchensis TaxID=3332 RepID=A0A6B9XTC7_PICSI|nr:hypothetical protein Q903MT_gene4311 [Picea sitchensis]
MVLGIDLEHLVLDQLMLRSFSPICLFISSLIANTRGRGGSKGGMDGYSSSLISSGANSINRYVYP